MGLGKGHQQRLDPRNFRVVHTVFSGCRDSLGGGDWCGGDIRDLALERVARFPPLYPAGNSDIKPPFKAKFLTRFDVNK